MRKITTLLTIATLGVALSCEESPDTGPAAPQLLSTVEDMVELLPGSTLAAVELINVAGRWDELRATPGIAGLQDRFLAELGLVADDVPGIAGEGMVMGLISDESSRHAVPVAVLDPPSRSEVLARLGASEALIAVEARGAIWVGVASHTAALERIATGDGTSIRQAVDLDELSDRLPPGGLVRGVVNPSALSEHLKRRSEYAAGRPVGKIASIIAADLEAIEVIGFRRDLVDGALVTDAWVGIDRDAVPEEVTRALATDDRGPAVLPTPLPENLIVAKGFRAEPEAALAWMRFLAERDPEGPLRNLDFWIEEFEARSARDVETDIVAAIGERGVSVVVESEGLFGVDFVVILEANEPERLEAALIDLRDWLAELIRGRTAGMVNLNGPIIQPVNDHLVIAMSWNALDLGAELAASADAWTTPDWALGEGPPDEIAVIRMNAVARLLGDRVDSADPERWIDALIDFLAGAGDARIVEHFEDDGARVHGELDI